jgi:hypothetical protein
MAFTYHDIVADAAIRISALIGVDSAALNTTFLVRPLTQANFQSTVFPFEPVKTAVLMAEGKLARAIANSNDSMRDYLHSTTAALANQAQLPSLDVNGKQIIGVWGDVHDASDGKPCRPNTLANIQRIIDNAGSRYLLQSYFYNRTRDRIYHTRTTVKIDCCFYDAVTQETAIDNDSAVLLPFASKEAYVNGAVTMFVRDDEFVNQSQLYRANFQNALDSFVPVQLAA